MAESLTRVVGRILGDGVVVDETTVYVEPVVDHGGLVAKNSAEVSNGVELGVGGLDDGEK